jgi:hypothetical protein
MRKTINYSKEAAVSSWAAVTPGSRQSGDLIDPAVVARYAFLDDVA